MKKLPLRLLSALYLCSMLLLSSCITREAEGCEDCPGGNNYFKIGESVYPINDAVLLWIDPNEYYGAFCNDFYLLTGEPTIGENGEWLRDGDGIYLECLSTNGDSIDGNEYSYYDAEYDETPILHFTRQSNFGFEDMGGERMFFTSGSFTASLKEDIYVIKLSGVLDDGQKIEACYSGIIRYFDKRIY